MKKKMVSSIFLGFFVFSGIAFGMDKQYFSLALRDNNSAVLSSFQYCLSAAGITGSGAEAIEGTAFIGKKYKEISTIYSLDFNSRIFWQCQNMRTPLMIKIKNYDEQQYNVTEIVTNDGSVVYPRAVAIGYDSIVTIEVSTNRDDIPKENILVTTVKYFSVPVLALFVLYYYRNNPMMLIFFEKKFTGC